MRMSDTERPYRVIRSEQHRIGRIRVVKDTIEINGTEHPFTYVDFRDSVCVLPVFRGNVIAIEQYRHTLNSWELELPCGGIDSGESPEAAARRELREETGYTAGEMKFLGKYYTNQGYSCAMCSVFFADCAAAGTAEPEETEFIRTRVIPLSEFEKMIGDNRFRLLIGITAWEQAKRRNLI